MMGRIQCPNCSNQIDIDHIDDKDDMVLTCPLCKYQFNIHPSSKCPEDSSNKIDECSWEEHGEPRKTILSSMKPRTDKPMIATFLLMIVVCIGIIASITPSLFLQTPLMVFSAVGSQGTISFEMQDINVSTIDQVVLSISQNNIEYSGIVKNDSILIKDLPIGLIDGELSIEKNGKNSIISNEFFVIPILSNRYVLYESDQNTIEVLHNGYGWCTAILIILSVVCLIGMFSSWRRNHSDLALFGSFIGIFTIGFYFIGTVLSILAFYLIYHSRDEFDDGKKGKSF